MSRENVEVVRRAYEAFTEDVAIGVFGRRLPEFAHPDIEWQPREATHPYRGYEEVAEAWRQWSDSMEQLTTEVEELIDAGNNILVVLRIVARGVSSGVTVAERIYPVFTVHDGKITRYVEYPTWEQALEAVGLRE